ncbi:hypothetical protein E4U21_006439 [Claviceps maximensis]|nr:hypothetical protein E4U21_006439 [Claviceps maximensis]
MHTQQPHVMLGLPSHQPPTSWGYTEAGGYREHDAQHVLCRERKSGLVLVDAAAIVAPHAMVSE